MSTLTFKWRLHFSISSFFTDSLADLKLRRLLKPLHSGDPIKSFGRASSCQSLANFSWSLSSRSQPVVKSIANPGDKLKFRADAVKRLLQKISARSTSGLPPKLYKHFLVKVLTEASPKFSMAPMSTLGFFVSGTAHTSDPSGPTSSGRGASNSVASVVRLSGGAAADEALTFTASVY